MAEVREFLLVDLADQRWQQALRRAVERRTMAVLAERSDVEARYVVRSASSDQTYDVVVRGDGITCTCPAAQHGKPCWHAAVAWLVETFPGRGGTP